MTSADLFESIYREQEEFLARGEVPPHIEMTRRELRLMLVRWSPERPMAMADGISGPITIFGVPVHVTDELSGVMDAQPASMINSEQCTLEEWAVAVDQLIGEITSSI